MGIELRGKNGAIDLSLKMIKGDDGGYYIPSLDSEGNLTWAPSETEMPAVEGANIKGPKGDTGTSGVWVGDTEPTGDYNVWIDPTGSETSGLVTQAELATKQDKLTAGDNITIDSNNIISATGLVTQAELENKQDKLTAGTNITIDSNNVISSTQPTKTSELTNDSGFITNEYHDATKQDKLTAGANITIDSNNVISATGGSGGGSSYIFTDGLTETDGTVKWDLNDRIASCTGNGSVYIGNITDPHTNINGQNNITNSYNALINGNRNAVFGGDNKYIYGNNNLQAGLVGTMNGSAGFMVGSNNTTGPNYCEFVMGNSCTVNGSDTLAVGEYLIAEGAHQVVIGRANIADTGGGWSNGIYTFIVGNGTSDSARSNAYTLDWQGNGTFAGTVSSSTGADYAEYFEWKDGNPNNEDRVGYIVTLDGDKIVKANSGDDILGICSGTAMVLGDSAEWNWSKRYLTDDFGRIIYEDYDIEHEEIKDKNTGEVLEEAWTEHIHAPKQNPDYDISQPYIRRSDRPEWQIVGMMGKLYVRDDGSCVVNGYADVVNGIATKATGKTNMRVMERINDSIVRVLLK